MIRVVYTLALAFLLSSCCSPAPWSAWEYNDVNQFASHPDPWNLPSQSDYPDLYVDGAFVHAFFSAHDETSNSGSPPYRLFANVTTNNEMHESVIFHSVKVNGSEQRNYPVQPITVNTAAKKTGELSFPSSGEFKTLKYYSTTLQTTGFKKVTLWTDETIHLEPKRGDVITVSIDLEIISGGVSVRDTVIYLFKPHRNWGLLQCISV